MAKPRWFRFSLRTLFVLVTLLACALGWLVWQIQIVRERKSLLSEVSRYNSSYPFDQLYFDVLEGKIAIYGPLPEQVRVSWVRRALGDNSYMSITLPEHVPANVIERVESAFPESHLYIRVYNGFDWKGASRDSLYEPIETRKPNTGNVFKTGLIEK